VRAVVCFFRAAQIDLVLPPRPVPPRAYIASSSAACSRAMLISSPSNPTIAHGIGFFLDVMILVSRPFRLRPPRKFPSKKEKEKKKKTGVP
jgi:hypothetical protein